MSRSPKRNNPNEGEGVSNLAYQALLRAMERIMQNQLEPIQERLDQLERRPQRGCSPSVPNVQRQQAPILL